MGKGNSGLILNRNVGQQIVICTEQGTIFLTVMSKSNGQVKLLFKCDNHDVRILRKEIYDLIQKENASGAV